MRPQYIGYLFLIAGAALLLGAAASAHSPAGAAQGSIPRPNVGAAGDSALSAPAVCLGWGSVPSPNVGSANNTLNGVAVAGPNDVWAVGTSFNGSALQTLTEHWNGSGWTVVGSPSVGTNENQLRGVAVAAPNDVWAVGYYWVGSSRHTLIEHWNGAAWTVTPSPSPDSGYNVLHGVAVAGPSDVWAVGGYGNNQSLIEHWNGTAWSVSPSANPGSDNLLYGVAATAGMAWAVGYYYNGYPQKTLIEQWNGTTWAVVPSPSPGSDDNLLNGVAIVGPSEAWAVGNALSGPARQTLTEHWNGTTWSVVASPSPDGSANTLNGVAGSGPSDVWAVGSAGSTSQTLIEYWNGAAWTVATSPNAGSADGLNAVAVAGPSDTWATGYYSAPTADQTLTVHYGDQCVTPSPTPLPTATPVCTIAFSDVDASNPFYSYIRCLACRGIVAGYSTSPPCTAGTPCFLPGNNVTRGQMAKFIANAAGYTDVIPSTQQTFTDVPPSNPFWLYVERAATHGVISGYTSSPPCTSGTPCFLPGNPVTRGQTSKFIANAAGYTDTIPSTQQTFTDVAASNPFWLYTERAVLHSVISGYTSSPPCTTGAPCFLPGNAVTRAQTSKFIANAFYPNCQTPAQASRTWP